jgi:hypothetical protein
MPEYLRFERGRDHDDNNNCGAIECRRLQSQLHDAAACLQAAVLRGHSQSKFNLRVGRLRS